MINHMLANDEDIERLLFIMANLPEFLRLSLARRKVRELISMAETERLESISRAFSCTSLIESNKMVELLGSWIRAMCEVESSVLTQLMVTYCKALLNEKNFICKYSEKVFECVLPASERRPRENHDLRKGSDFFKTSSQRVNKNTTSEAKNCYANLYLTLLPSSGFFFISSPFSRPKNIRSYFLSAFLCSGRDMSKRISLITITA